MTLGDWIALLCSIATVSVVLYAHRVERRGRP
jgi:hypothetical protein